MKDINKIDNLLKTKSYDQLNEEDLKLVKEEFASRESYEAYRQMVVLATENDYAPGRDVKRKLDESLRLVNPVWWQLILQAKVPAYAAVPAMVLLLVMGYILKSPEQIIIEKPQIVEAEPIIDTVFVENTVTDTLIIEKVRRVEVPVYISLNQKSGKEEMEEGLEGTSIKEQKVLFDLLTSAP